MRPSDHDPYRALLLASADAVLAEASSLGPLYAPAVVSRRLGDVSVTLVVTAGPEPPGLPLPLPELTRCEQDVVALLRAREGRETTSRIIALLATEARAGRMEWHGDRTVSRALGRLVRLGVLLSSRRSPRGYCLAPEYRVPALVVPDPASSAPDVATLAADVSRDGAGAGVGRDGVARHDGACYVACNSVTSRVTTTDTRGAT